MLGFSSFQAPKSILTEPVLSKLLPDMMSLKSSDKGRAEERWVEEDKNEVKIEIRITKRLKFR